MSANLMWEPAKRKAHSLPYGLMKVLRDRRGVDSTHRVFGLDELEYLGALRDAEIEGAAELIEAIEKHEEVDVWLEY